MAAKKAKVKAKAPAAKKEAKAAKKTGTAVAVADKGPDPKAVAKLVPIAHEINVRFEKAAKLDGQADDHRLAAAIQLAKAKELCDASGIKFKEWTGENVKQAYETVRKLVAIGASPNPAKALEDMRDKNKKANAALRERQQGEPAGHIAHQPDTEGNELGADGGGLPEIPTLEGVNALKAAFDLLKASEKMEFMHYAAEQTGVTLDTGFAGAETHPFTLAAKQVAGEIVAGNDAIEEIPAALKRTRKKAA